MPLAYYDDRRHAYFDQFGRVASVTQVLSASGIGGYDKYRMMQVTAPEKLKAAADRGRKVHTATELYDAGLLDWDALDPALEPYLIAYEKWLNWTHFEPLDIERMVYHESLRYAGRLDRIGRIGRTKWIVDFKSGILLPGHAYQTAAYLATLPDPACYDRMLVQLQPDGTFHIDTPEKRTFLTHLQIFAHALEEHRAEIEGVHEHATA